MSKVIAKLTADVPGQIGTYTLALVIEESGGRYWIREEGAPEIEATEQIKIVPEHPSGVDMGMVITLTVEAP